MAYTPTEWQSGDIVTSAKLNKIEQGIVEASGGVPFYSLAEGNDAWALVDMEGNTPTYNDILFKPVAVSSDAGILSMGLCAMYTVDDSPVYSFGVAFASALSVGGSPVALFTTANATSENGDDPIDNITVQNYTGEVTEL